MTKVFTKVQGKILRKELGLGLLPSRYTHHLDLSLPGLTSFSAIFVAAILAPSRPWTRS